MSFTFGSVAGEIARTRQADQLAAAERRRMARTAARVLRRRGVGGAGDCCIPPRARNGRREHSGRGAGKRTTR